MNLTQTQLLLLIATIAGAIGYLLAKVLEATIEKLHLGPFMYVTGVGALLALVGLLNSLGVSY